ncbi:MAG TPA: hypothetical protein DCS09_08880 [Porphyromonadaceae bacterium]|nr:hypothetical protein [Porphyromonadaceae bacterium]
MPEDIRKNGLRRGWSRGKISTALWQIYHRAETGKSRDLAEEALGVGGKSVDHATKVLTKGVHELVKAVEEGRMAVSSSAALASEPEEDQERNFQH